MKILLIDDSIDTGLVIKQCLIPLEVTQAFTINEARIIIETTHFDLVLIDVELPDGNGFNFCSELSNHSTYATVPLIMLTASDQLSDKVYGLNCGACDYITKPFHTTELKARIQAHLRHHRILNDTSLKTKYFELNSTLQKCFIFEKSTKKDIELTPTEYRLFFSLYRHKGIPMSREEIIRTVWSNHGTSIEQKGLDTHIAHLRKKLGQLAERIHSIYGVGYAYYEKE